MMDEMMEELEQSDAGVQEDGGEAGGGFAGDVSGNAAFPEDAGGDQDGSQESGYDELLEFFSESKDFGAAGDYYNAAFGCYVFPSYDVLAYFFDMEAEGSGWAEASDGHWLPAAYLERYEEYLSGPAEGNGVNEEQARTVSMDENSLAALGEIQAAIEEIRDADAAYYETAADGIKDIETASAVTMTFTIAAAIFIGIIGGSFWAHAFWNRLKGG